MSKLVPSPDWFIGLDSLDLCHNGSFAPSVSRALQPQDGGTENLTENRGGEKIIQNSKNICSGTDNGFTFTSPNWPTVPRGVVFPISSQYPAHPAGSFHYPHLATLPSIATIHLTKVTSSLVHRTSRGYCF